MARETKTSAMGLCPISNSHVLRAAANKKTDAIKDHFPPGIAKPALRALTGAGYTKLEQLKNAKEADLANLHGMGPKAIGILRVALKAKKLSFKK
jgi:hypothetical protein